MMNYIASGKAIVFIKKNNYKGVQQTIAYQYYNHVFTSPKIALSKKFKASVLDNLWFSSPLSLLAINEIYLIEKWGKGFWQFYAEIEKVRKHILSQVLFVEVSAILTEVAQLQVLATAGFFDKYKLMQMSLDCLKIE